MFVVIDRSTWLKALLAALLLAGAGLFYLYSRAEERASPAGSRLVLLDPIRLSPEREEPFGDPAGAAAAAETGEETAVSSSPPVVSERRSPPAPLEEPTGAAGPYRAAEAQPVLSQALSRSQEFDLARIARLQARSRRREELEAALAREELSAAAREAIQREILALARRDEAERHAESLLVARGFADALVIIGEHGAEVVVAGEVDREEAGRIGDLVARVSGVSLEQVVIVDNAPGRAVR